MLLYHGTLVSRLPSILATGLKASEGWGGQGSKGVFLAPDKESAMYWAKVAAVHSYNDDSEEYSLDDDEYDRLPVEWKQAVVIGVRVPADKTGLLLPDIEQAEDFGFNPDEVTLEDSLGYGAAVYPHNIPPEWIVPLTANRRRRSSSRRRTSRR